MKACRMVLLKAMMLTLMASNNIEQLETTRRTNQKSSSNTHSNSQQDTALTLKRRSMELKQPPRTTWIWTAAGQLREHGN